MAGSLVVRPSPWEEDRLLWQVYLDATVDQMRRSGQVIVPGPLTYETYPLRVLRRHLWENGFTYAAISGKKPVAYARCIRRGDTWELTEFFTHPAAQNRGTGRALLEACLEHAAGAGQRLVVASLDPPALARYLGAGLAAHQPIHQLEAPEPGPSADLGDLTPVRAGPADIPTLDALDVGAIGYSRGEEHRYWLEAGRACFLLQRDGAAAGYVYVGPRAGCGPGVARRAEDAGPLAAFAVAGGATRAGPAAAPNLSPRRFFAVPGSNLGALQALLAAGARLLPLPNLLMAARPLPGSDRYLSFGPYLL